MRGDARGIVAIAAPPPFPRPIGLSNTGARTGAVRFDANETDDATTETASDDAWLAAAAARRDAGVAREPLAAAALDALVSLRETHASAFFRRGAAATAAAAALVAVARPPVCAAAGRFFEAPRRRRRGVWRGRASPKTRRKTTRQKARRRAKQKRRKWRKRASSFLRRARRRLGEERLGEEKKNRRGRRAIFRTRRRPARATIDRNDDARTRSSLCVLPSQEKYFQTPNTLRVPQCICHTTFTSSPFRTSAWGRWDRPKGRRGPRWRCGARW